MNANRVRVAMSLCFLLIATPSRAGTGQFCALGQNIRLVAEAVVDGYAAEKAAGRDTDAFLTTDFRTDNDYWPRISLFAILGTLGSSDSCRLLNEVQTLPFVKGEVARTDQQLGSAPASGGTTSVTEKSGLSRLLALAVEHGAVQQERNGTTLTLRTTPYVGVALLGGDSAENYERFHLLDRLGLSATAQLGENVVTADDLQFADFSQFSARVGLWGDRSTRSARFVDMWLDAFGPEFDNLLTAETGTLSALFNEGELRAVKKARDEGGLTASKEIRQFLAQNPDVPRSAQVDGVQKILFQALQDFVKSSLDPIVSNPAERERISAKLGIDTRLVPAIVDAYRGLYGGPEREAYNRRYRALIEELDRTPLLTAIYTANRVKDGTDYSDMKLSFTGRLWQTDVVVNAGISLNHSPVHSLGQRTIRDYAGAVTLERKFRADFFPRFGAEDLSYVTASVSGRLDYNEDINKPIGAAQARIEIPIAKGFRLPLALTYSSRSETSAESEFRINAGVNFDTDTLIGLLAGG